MTDLAEFTTDRDVMQDGDWITVGPVGQQFDIRTRGFTRAYRDHLAELRRQAARELNRKLAPGDVLYTPDSLPPSVDDRCQGVALVDRCVLDVRGLTNKKVPVTVDQFCEMLRDPAGRVGLLILAMGAAGRVGQDRQEQQEQAEGNS